MNRDEATRRAERQVKVARIDTNLAGVVTTEWELSNAGVCSSFDEEDTANVERDSQRVAVALELMRNH